MDVAQKINHPIPEVDAICLAASQHGIVTHVEIIRWHKSDCRNDEVITFPTINIAGIYR
jgi:hypothetical protein